MRVLVAEDDANCRQILELLLTHAGWQVSLAADGRAACALAAAEPFDLVVLDILMPVMGGIEAIGALRGLPRYREVPILALTALAFEQERAEVMQAGFDMVVVKPFTRRQLLAAVERFFPPLPEPARTA